MIVETTNSLPELVVLAPQRAGVPPVFSAATHDRDGYEGLLAGMQRLRGSAYLEDGAILSSDLTADGRHVLPIDRQSWHVLALSEGKICACLRFLDETGAASLEQMWIRHSSVARTGSLSKLFRRAVETEAARARAEGIRFGEVGGWAIATGSRCSLQAPRILLATYALLEMLGGCVGVATATLRHGSAGLLRRIGLRGAGWDGFELPRYYDPQYDCEMELLRFDSRRPSERYQDRVREFMTEMLSVRVVCGDALPATEAAAAPSRPFPHFVPPPLEAIPLAS